MKIILREDIERLGKRGDIVQVKDGYARNYLIPQGKALPATPGYLRQFEEEKRMELVREGKKKRAADELANRLNKVSLTAVAKAFEEDKLYGSVTALDVAELLAKEGFEIDKKNILLDEPIKSLGVYTIPIKLHPEVQVNIKLWVVRE